VTVPADHVRRRDAADGLVAHLMYAGVSSSYVVGGDRHNEPE